MCSLNCVPCIQINGSNVSIWSKKVIECIRGCHFVALDLELSGLGDRQKLSAKKIDERYSGVVEAAKTRSVLSIGFAFFNFCDNSSQTINQSLDTLKVTKTTEQNNCDINCLINSFEDKNRFEGLNDLAEEVETEDIVSENLSENQKKWDLRANVFNMLCLCEDQYICEPETMRFLAGHGFDFNRQCLHGLPYRRGNDKEFNDRTQPTLRNFISEIILRKVPIVLHNGFIDLIFLYQNFYSELPEDLQTFIADLVELFPNGIFDTKYIADFHERLNRSYLEYLFYERQRYNIERSIKGQVSIQLSFDEYSEESLDVEYKDLSTNLFNESNLLVDICYDYANHGWCKMNHSCSRSHNIDHILDKKKNKTKKLKKMIKKVKLKSEEQNNDNSNGDVSSVESNNSKQTKKGVHSAGYDAFMTGYCLAFYIAVNSKSKLNSTQALSLKNADISQIVNNIYLTGKDQSLRITASSFAKPSTHHKNKILNLRSNNSNK